MSDKLDDLHPLFALTMVLEHVIADFNLWADGKDVPPREQRAFYQAVEQAQIVLDWIRINDQKGTA